MERGGSLDVVYDVIGEKGEVTLYIHEDKRMRCSSALVLLSNDNALDS